MASSVTPPVVEVEEVKEEGIVEATRSVVSTHGRFS